MTMTEARLSQYLNLTEEKSLLESNAGISYIGGIDTTKPSVQSGKIGKPTENVGLKLYELDTELNGRYRDVVNELQEITKFIVHIKDNDVRIIAIRRFMKGQGFQQIGEAMHYDRTTVSKKLRNYLSHNSH